MKNHVFNPFLPSWEYVPDGRYEARIACNLSGRDGIINSADAWKKDKKNLLPYFAQSGEDWGENGDQYIANLRHGACSNGGLLSWSNNYIKK